VCSVQGLIFDDLGTRFKVKLRDDMSRCKKKTIPVEFMLAATAVTTGLPCFLLVRSFPGEMLTLAEVCALGDRVILSDLVILLLFCSIVHVSNDTDSVFF